MRRRLDTELVRRGLAPSGERARADIAAGRVLVSGARADKASRLVGAAEPVVVTGAAPRFVSRGGDKLDAALERFAVDVGDRRALDAGASTGGFTDCLLQRGARSVVAVDVGRAQLHERLRDDPRVTVLDRRNIRHLSVEDAGGEPFTVVTADLSFISLVTVMAPLLALTGDDGALVLLVKPQFEVGRAAATRGRGVIRDPSEWAGVLRRVAGAARAEQAAMMGLMVSPLKGADGNVEFLAHVRRDRPSATTGPAGADADLDAVVDAVVAEAADRER